LLSEFYLYVIFTAQKPG